MRKLIRLLALAGLTTSPLVLVGPGDPAQALPGTTAVCTVSANGHTDFLTYVFIDSEVECLGSFDDVLGQGTYLVYGSTLTGALTNSLQMETCEGGQNHRLGSLHAHKMDGPEDWPLLLSGTVHYLRVGRTVYALGLIHHDPDGLLVHWYGEFTFSPAVEDFEFSCVQGGTPSLIDNAELVGIAQISDALLV